MDTHEAIAYRYAHLAWALDERGRRLLAATEAVVLGRGGLMAVARATGLSRKAIALGIRELRGEVPPPPPGRVRRPGGGRKSLEAHDPTLRADRERRSGVAAALDEQERAPAGRRAGAARACGQPSEGGRGAARVGLQLASESQDARREP